jgi:uncharacterized protein DUF29
VRARDRRALASHLENLLLHLLKWRYQPAGRQTGHSWADSIREARTQLATGLTDAYAASPHFHHSMVRRYRAARREASRQTSLPLATFPEACPWTLRQLLDEAFFPEP